ncbi:N-acetylneuraminic acid mutarotase [Parabacteroides sp. PF5-5]|uniref:Kelch repeat-containing protein n=1 Tax=unclassified Parabacteroides TaxID=2649774 RepID=UPI00247420A6|nr:MULTISPECIES: kelch repeat-containing protein [unclassified Parabacteroides]MDH6306907.1 N-acetylneuraminic acid mutarotase [Parabacteroides sp. PH5-39]MDH6317705.1 N-acetylneuraminic acid mutarotase [Parabacteroides sp. PF5-13]MDH6321708.1 N-acetylneuraminic acid mutarotase [Parabacteroides sp. PH5-13]MDH6325294.1 N-acetylneuraminic acid mutarotase [Parabacteroides sp. PH5-8]MDH6328890.1 N-acetylneuraminic acid mutarotase [Parabacteroides sp. PH5-41]
MTQHKLIALLIALFPAFFSSCGDDDDDDLIGKWYRVSDMDGLARSDASSFTIGNKGYLVCGYTGSERLTDLWEYDIAQDFWTQKAAFPGTARNSAVGFSVGSKGYLGTGFDGENYLNDFWEYDPASNNWTQKADFPASARIGAVAFGLSGKGYIGCGYDGNYQKDFYAFTPSTNSWEQIISIGGSKRQGATAFVMNDNVAYVCCGQNNGDHIYDFWKYDASTKQWTQLRDIANTSDDDYDDDYNIVRANAVAFVIDGAAYIACGENSGSLRTDTWKYYPTTDLWENVSKFKGSARTVAASFSTGERGFVVSGKSGTYRFDDIWELHPYEYDDDEY